VPPHVAADVVAERKEPRARADLSLENLVEECVTVRLARDDDARSVEAVHVSYALKRNTGECGCKSRGLTYRVVEPNPGGRPSAPEAELLNGSFVPSEGLGTFDVRVPLETQMSNVQPRIFRLGCQVSP
jgi:hypothetical protein